MVMLQNMPTAMLHHRSLTDDSAKVERVEKYSDFVKAFKNVRILVWDEHCVLFKNIEVIL